MNEKRPSRFSLHASGIPPRRDEFFHIHKHENFTEMTIIIIIIIIIVMLIVIIIMIIIIIICNMIKTHS